MNRYLKSIIVKALLVDLLMLFFLLGYQQTEVLFNKSYRLTLKALGPPGIVENARVKFLVSIIACGVIIYILVRPARKGSK